MCLSGEVGAPNQLIQICASIPLLDLEIMSKLSPSALVYNWFILTIQSSALQCVVFFVVCSCMNMDCPPVGEVLGHIMMILLSNGWLRICIRNCICLYVCICICIPMRVGRPSERGWDTVGSCGTMAPYGRDAVTAITRLNGCYAILCSNTSITRLNGW